MNMFLQLYEKKNVVFQLHSEAQNKNTKIFVKKPKWNLGNIRVSSFYLWRGIYCLGIIVGRSSCDEHMIQLFIRRKPLEGIFIKMMHLYGSQQ